MNIIENPDGTFTLESVTPQELGSITAGYQRSTYENERDCCQRHEWPYLNRHDSNALVTKLHIFMTNYRISGGAGR